MPKHNHNLWQTNYSNSRGSLVACVEKDTYYLPNEAQTTQFDDGESFGLLPPYYVL